MLGHVHCDLLNYNVHHVTTTYLYFKSHCALGHGDLYLNSSALYLQAIVALIIAH